MKFCKLKNKDVKKLEQMKRFISDGSDIFFIKPPAKKIIRTTTTTNDFKERIDR